MRAKAADTVSLLLLLLFAVIPLVLGIAYALLYSFGVVGVLNNGFTLDNWVAAFATNEVLFSFLYTVALSVLSLFICVAAGMYISLSLQKKLQKGFASYIIYLPLAFPSIVAAFFFFQALSNAGLLSRIFYKMRIIESVTSFPDLINDPYSIGIIIAQTFVTLPVFVLLFISILANENIYKLKTLAASLGANASQILWKITVPALLKKSFPVLVLYFIFKLGSYEIPLLLGRSSPETISVIIVRKMQRFNLMDIPQGYAIAVLYAVLVLILLFTVFKPSRSSINV